MGSRDRRARGIDAAPMKSCALGLEVPATLLAIADEVMD
jgi:hypothetical protein